MTVALRPGFGALVVQQRRSVVKPAGVDLWKWHIRRGGAGGRAYPILCMREEDGRIPVATEDETSSGDGRLRRDRHESMNGHGGLVEELLPRLDQVVSGGAVGEVMEVAAQAASRVGEITELSQVEEPRVDTSDALKTVALWIASAVAFGTVIGIKEGSSKASEFFSGYLLEQSLSVDNLVVFVLIFNYFRVPVQYQSRVLTYGLAGAVVFRATMITLGAATIQRFEAVNLLFAAVLLLTAYKVLTGLDDEEEDLSDSFIVKCCQKLIPVSSAYDGNKFFTVVDGVGMATPLFLTVVTLELSDVAFAVDSIPAVFGVTKDPLIVFSSNMFAILGLRSLYTLISANLGGLEYLQPAVGAVLGFIGSKMVVEFLGFHVPTEVSLGVVAALLGTGVALSLLTRKDASNADESET